MIDVYASVEGRDLGGVDADIQKVLEDFQSKLPRGTQLVRRGQVATMTSSFAGLSAGVGVAIVLVYLLIVVNFQSWLDPFIIITALPGALAGIIWILLLTHTTLSVPSLTGTIMCMGVATANSILMVSFARERLSEGLNSTQAAVAGGLRPHSPGADDRAGDDHRHGADVAGPWAKAASRTRRSAARSSAA